ncbi:hypothetical protein IU402_08355 [Aerococcaceae bacterium zg-BR9]|uniref:competence protein CoiA family protein n=1 Tax=Aerococcaceae bacterium zg-1292 TaxID=2774330 RepID=UPI0040645F16|nr:hypothetical protein [Aerococcaceae bacterium zg-BR9]
MYAALDEQHQLVYAQQLTCPTGRYFCPRCHQVVIVKMSKKHKYYFAHLEACQQAGRQTKHQGESAHHQQVKQLLAKGHPNSNIEYWLDSIQQQVDVWYPTAPPMILEFQKSKINETLLRKRHQAYRELTPNVYWFSDDCEWQHPKISKWQKQLLYYQAAFGYHGYTVDIQTQTIHRYSHLPILYCVESWYCFHTSIASMDKVPALLVADNTFPAKKLQFHAKRQLHPNRMRQSLMQAELYFPFFHALRRLGITLHDVPDWIFATSWECLLLCTPTWQLLSLVWVYLYRADVGVTITFEQMRVHLLSLIEQQYIQLVMMPLVEKETTSDLTQAIIRCFEHYGHLFRKSQDEWFVK